MALLKLETPLDVAGSPYLGTICVPEQDDTYDEWVGRMATTAGWGRLASGGDSPDVLMKVNLPVVSMDYCVKQERLTVSVNSMICTYSDHGRDACKVGVFRILNAKVTFFAITK